MRFGKSDGFSESKEPNFSEMYYDRDGVYERLLRKDKYIIIGRKGTGKTALASYFCHKNSSEKAISVQLFSDDFIQKKLLNFAEDPINKEENSLFWQYVFLLDFAQQLSNYYSRLRFYSINKLLYKKKFEELKSILKNEIYKIEQITSENYYQNDSMNSVKLSMQSEVNVSNNNIYSERESLTKRRSKYYETLPALKNNILELLSVLDIKITIFYDDMDQFEESMDIQSFKNLMKNMIYTADKLNKELYNSTDSKICLVIREDIVDILQSEANNLNKQITDCGIVIDWFLAAYREPQNHPLMQMVLHKIKNSDSDFENASLEEVYQNVFDSQVFRYLLERSFGRPRDIIRFLNLYQQEFPEEERITKNNLSKIEQGYSKWFYTELLNEIAISEEKLEIQLLLNYISKRGYRRFTFVKLSDYIFNETGEHNENLLKTLSSMQKYGILGVVNKNNKFDFIHRSGISPNVNKNTNFIVHKGLHKFLNM